MNLKRLLDGPSKVNTNIGPEHEIIRIAPQLVERDFKRIFVCFREVTINRSFFYPWRKNIKLKAWEIQATIRLKNGTSHSVHKVMQLDFERAVNTAVLEVQKQATLHRLAQIRLLTAAAAQ